MLRFRLVRSAPHSPAADTAAADTAAADTAAAAVRSSNGGRRLPAIALITAVALLVSTAPRLVFWAASPAPVAQAAPGAPVLALRAPAIYAGSAYLLDMDTGQVLFQKFPTARRPMASAAKIMTGLLAAESGRLDEVATVSRRAAAIGETTMGLVEGEQVPVGELLFGLLMNSGNDAAVVLAEHLAGSVDAFATWMNERAAALGLAGTQYANPHGLDHGIFASPQQYSTARDLAVLASTAMGSPVFARAAGSRLREVAAPPDKEPHRLRHTIGALWWYPGATGVKTGWTGRAGQVRVVTAERGGTRLVAVVMGSPDHVAETRALLDYGFASSAKADVQKLVPLGPEALPTPAPRLAQAWETYKQLALAPDGRIRRGAGGRDATSDAQAAALLHAVWFRDRPAFDSVWSWTKTALSRRESEQRDRLFAGRWSNGAVTDWNNATAADQRIAAALLLASRLWNEPHYEAEAVPVLNTLLNRAAISWHGVGGIPAANTFLNDLDPVTTSAATLTPAFYRMFAEASRSDVWLWLLEGTYATLERAMASGGPLGRGAGLLPSWYSVSRRDGRVGDPIDPTWQSTGFGDTSPALAWQLALDMRWHPEHGDERARTLLAPTARFLAGELAQRGSIAGTYSRIGGAARTAETASYGALAGIALPELEPKSEAALRAKLDAALGSRDPDRLLDAIDGLWLLAGGPPNFWRVWWPPEDLPTARNDGVVPPDDERPWQYFGETGHVVQGRFLEYFRQHGGAGTLGLPRTDELVEDGRVVQYFQRARLEYFPEREGTGTEVVPAPLGRRAAAARGVLTREAAKPVVPFESDESRTYVPETGHSLSGGFRTFYERTGGADILGYPLTEELVEDGFTVQYFERAVLEYVPGRPIQGELLGDKLLAEEGWQK